MATPEVLCTPEQAQTYYNYLAQGLEAKVVEKVKAKVGAAAALIAGPFAVAKTRKITIEAIQRTFTADEITMLVKLHGNQSIGPVLTKILDLIENSEKVAAEHGYTV